MIIRIMGVDLEDWEYLDGLNWFVRNSITYWNKIRVASILETTKWTIGFYGKISVLRDMYSGPYIFDTAEDAKNYIDEWLIKMANLKAFW